MAKHIGIVACSAEGAALCYRTICLEAQERMGEDCHPEITMHTQCLGDYMKAVITGDWKEVARLMLDSAWKVAGAGAHFAICPDNTIHQALALMEAESPLPWLHIARVVAQEAQRQGFTRLGILGTKYLMEGPVYPDALSALGIECLLPDERDRARIDAVIFRELVKGRLLKRSRTYLNEVMQELKERGAEAAVLGCTEIPLVVDPKNAPLPTLDSTRLLARAAIERALEEPVPEPEEAADTPQT
jgi:aspartate racemase